MHWAFLLAATLVSAKRPYTANDQVNLRRLQAITASPDGKLVALSVRETDYEANKGRLDLWVVNADGTGLRQLTSNPAPDTDATWAPDGKSLFFLSPRGGSSQVWRLSLEGGEPVQVTQSPIDLNTFVLSRDGKQLAFAADVFLNCDLDCTKKRLDEKAKSKASGQLYDQLLYRHWDSWSDGRRSHVFVQPVAGGPAKDVMKALDADAPSKPFGGSEEFTFSPDGKQVVFTARAVGREEAWSTDLDLFVANADGSGTPKKLTEKNRATDTSPVFSPDGKSLAYVAMKRPGYEADQLFIRIRDWATGAERELAWDKSADGIAWSADGKTLYARAWDLGQLKLFALDAQSGQATALVSTGHVAALSVAGPTLFIAHDSLSGPADLLSLPATGGATKALTQLNQDKLKDVQLGEYEQFKFAGWNGETVHGYLVKPVGFDPKKKYPLAFLIHGGPQGSFGNDWHYRWNPQVYAGAGYVAVMIDFHGSVGYGQAFTDSIRGDWGGKPFEDLQKGLAHVLKSYTFVDAGRTCALGASYGGYMINWIAGNWPDQFKCLVNHDGNLDERFAYFDTEELWFPEWEHGGTPWDQAMGYSKHNPIDHVAKWKTPMLVVHGGKDYRVVDTQGMATFTALQRRGIPSKFLYFPDENHWVLKPQNSVQWHETVLAWLGQWTKK